MAEKEIFSHKADVLRQRAEEKAVGMTENLEAMSLEEIRRILHELHVHQIELEMQNDHLQRAHVEIDAARERYYALYDLAPIGYFTLSEHGLFLEANLAAFTMLGVNWGTLIKQRISMFILEDDHAIYYRYRNRLFETHSALGHGSVQANPGQTGEPQGCELRMVKNDGSLFWAHLAATVRQDAGAAPVIMGGTIQAESTPGKGSLFTVVLSFLISSGIGRTNLLRHLDTRRIRLPQEKCAADELYPLTKQKRKLGSAAELHPLLERLKLAIASEEPMPCMKILEELSQRRWSESH